MNVDRYQGELMGELDKQPASLVFTVNMSGRVGISGRVVELYQNENSLQLFRIS